MYENIKLCNKYLNSKSNYKFLDWLHKKSYIDDNDLLKINEINKIFDIPKENLLPKKKVEFLYVDSDNLKNLMKKKGFIYLTLL